MSEGSKGSNGNLKRTDEQLRRDLISAIGSTIDLLLTGDTESGLKEGC
jgi:hypothetical protein